MLANFGLKSKVWFGYPHIIRSLYTHIVDAIMDWKLNKCMSFFTPKLCSIFSGIEMYSKINISIEQNSSCEDSRTLATAATRYNITTMSAEPSLYYSHSSTKQPYYTIYNSTFVINSNFWLDSESTLPCTTTTNFAGIRRSTIKYLVCGNPAINQTNVVFIKSAIVFLIMIIFYQLTEICFTSRFEIYTRSST